MGQYFQVINATQKIAISPYSFDHGAKYGECWEGIFGGQPSFRDLMERLANGPWKNDVVLLIGDEGHGERVGKSRKDPKRLASKQPGYWHEVAEGFTSIGQKEVNQLLSAKRATKKKTKSGKKTKKKGK